MFENNNEKTQEDEDDSSLSSSDLFSENEDNICGLENKDKSKTGNFLLPKLEICKRDRFFSEDSSSKINHSKINSRVSENLKQSLYYLKNLEKEELLNVRKFTLSSSSSN